MNSFLILRFSSGNTHTIFKVIDRLLDNGTDFVSFILFFCTTDSSGICSQISFRVDINHSTAF